LKILNVTPDEFLEIQDAEHDGNLQHYMFLKFNIICGNYKIQVRKDVPFIPFISKNIYRVEND